MENNNPSDTPVEPPIDKPTELSVDKVDDKPTEPSVDKVDDKPTEPSVDKVDDKPIEPSIDKVDDKPTESVSKPIENLLEEITECHCVNLKEREDRWKTTVNEMTKLQKIMPHIELVRFDAIKDAKNPKGGLNKSITQIIKNAKDKGLDMVLFIEDDLEFLSIKKLVECLSLKNLPKDWDVLSGGSYQSRNVKPVNTHWATTESFCSMHFMIVKNTMYNYFLSPGCPETKHIDRWLEETVKKNRKKYYLMNPMPVRQYAGFSNLRKTKVDDNKRKGLNWHPKEN